MTWHKLSALIIALGISTGIFADQPGHSVSGTYYEKEGLQAYATYRHGPDGALFLDPYFIPYLLHLENQEVLDAGCGAGPWSVFAAENGAQVFGIDLQEKMIELATSAILKSGVKDKVSLAVGDVAELPCKDVFFDRALSINVGCNLPSTIQVSEKKVGLGPHMQEMARVLKAGGVAVITAPASFGVVFTDGTSQGKVLAHIDGLLQKLPKNPSTVEISSHLNQLKEVYRATFVLRESKLVLVTDENMLVPGEEIWRKLPGLTVPNRYHAEAEYLRAFADAGLKVKELHRPKFSNEEERLRYNANYPDKGLIGAEYVQKHPFVIFCVEKK